MAQQLTKENTRTIVKCGKCGSSEVEIRAWVSPNLDNAFSMYYDGDSLEDTETCYCRKCGEWTKPAFEKVEIPPADPWRCRNCGSIAVEEQVWCCVNTGETTCEAQDRDEFYCGDCDTHDWLIQESELMQDVIEPWWKIETTKEDMEAITGLNMNNYSPDNDYRPFYDACNVFWDAKTIEEKINIWRTITQKEE